MSRQPDIDQLAAVSHHDPHDVQARAELWEAVISLPNWFLLPVTEGETVAPLVLDVGGQKMIAAFTDARLARVYAQEHGYSEDDSHSVLEIPTPDIRDFFEAWQAAGAWGLVFSPSTHAYTAPFDSLTAMITLEWSAISDDES